MKNFVDFDPEQYGIHEKVCRKVLFEMLEQLKGAAPEAGGCH